MKKLEEFKKMMEELEPFLPKKPKIIRIKNDWTLFEINGKNEN